MRKIVLFLMSLCIFTLSACTFIEEPLPQQATPVVTETPTATLAPLPSATPESTSTFTPAATLPPTNTPTPAAPPKPYALQPGAMITLPAFTHADAGCAWMGLAGQVIGEDGQPVKNLVISVSAVQNGVPVEWMGYTGLATAYGPGGFEIQLGNQVAAMELTIQLFDLDGEMLSEPFTFTTSADCQQNLTLINFSPNRNLQPVIFLPAITR